MRNWELWTLVLSAGRPGNLPKVTTLVPFRRLTPSQPPSTIW